MLSRYNPIIIDQVLRQVEPEPIFPPITNRGAWETAARTLDPRELETLIHDAEQDSQRPIPTATATDWLEFQRTGQREGHQELRRDRMQMLHNLAFAECFENRGRFLDGILNVAWAICEESSWVMPAHYAPLPDVDYPYIDLGAASIAFDLAELDVILGSVLDSVLRRRIRREIEQRIITPYLTRHDFWWLHNSLDRTMNNWTAVCNCGIAAAAIHLLNDDPARQAEVLARATRSMDDYLATFDADGGSSEGPGYWDYGFSSFTMLAHLVEARTQGQIDFFAEEAIREIAQFPLKTMLAPGVSVNFSDSDPYLSFTRSHLAFLAQRLKLPQLATLATMQPQAGRQGDIVWGLRNLFWQVPATAPTRFVPNRHDWFSEMMWMIARNDPKDPTELVLAAKGGHNDEMHNQNDVGNFIVFVQGEAIIPDIGRGRYTKDYFDPEKRYDHLVNASLGHSVPMPNGQLQGTGATFTAQLLQHQTTDSKDQLIIEMKDAYPPEAGLASLKRNLTLHRNEDLPWVELVDSFSFADAPGTFDSALTTFGHVEVGEEGMVIQGDRAKLRVTFEPEKVRVRVDTYNEVDLAHGPRDVHRIVFTWREPAQQGELRLELVPVS